jgi:hypothetical protein
VLALGCGGDSTGLSTRGGRVTGFAVSANENNVLSAIATFGASNADSVRVAYWTGTETPQYTPFSTNVSAGRLVVLGLRPQTPYSMFVQAASGSTLTPSDTLTFTTGALPDFLANARIAAQNVLQGGYVLTLVTQGTSAATVAFDSAGQVAWYRVFDEGVGGGETKQQSNGDITFFLGNTHGGDLVPGRFVEIAPDGSIVRTITAPDTAYADNHELWILTNNGSYDGAVYLTYTAHHVDLSSQGGPADTLVTGHQLVRVNADGTQNVVFDAWTHFGLADNVEPSPGQLDFDHANAIALASDGNYIVSWRNFDAITKIDATTGSVIWTLASPWAHVASDFTITGDPLGGFSAQHSVREVGNGNLLIFDNGTHHSPAQSRAVEYALDPAAHTASLVWEYRHSPPVYTQFTGSVQRLSDGGTFISWPWGNPLLATEVAPDKSVRWEGTLQPPSPAPPYRMIKIKSLYRYEQP